MKKWGLLVMAFMLAGCVGVPAPIDEQQEVTEQMSQQPQQQKSGVAQKLEDYNTYIPFDNTNFSFGLLPCRENPEAEEIINTALSGEMKMQTLFTSQTGYNFEVFATPNPNNLTQEQFVALNESCGDDASKRALKAYETHLVWGYPYCTVGIAAEEDDPLYKEYLECEKVQNELLEYLELNEASTETNTESNNPNFGEQGS